MNLFIFIFLGYLFKLCRLQNISIIYANNSFVGINSTGTLSDPFPSLDSMLAYILNETTINQWDISIINTNNSYVFQSNYISNEPILINFKSYEETSTLEFNGGITTFLNMGLTFNNLIFILMRQFLLIIWHYILHNIRLKIDVNPNTMFNKIIKMLTKIKTNG